jgi:hypothetical protein
MDYMQIANSVPMWIAAGLAVGLVLFQASIFVKKSYSTGKEMGITEGQMKSAMRSSLITSIGPSLVILTGVLALLVTVGGPMSWMRLSFIGSIMFELMAVGVGTEAVGVQLGVDQVTNLAFASAVWTMILGSLGWIIVATLGADKMDRLQSKVSKGDPMLVKVISISAMLGAFGSMVSTHLIALNRNTVAAVAGGLIMAIVITIGDKKNISWLKEWGLAMALFGGMIVAALV